MESQYMNYLKSFKYDGIYEIIKDYENGNIDFNQVTFKVSPVIYEGVMTYNVFCKSKKIDDLLK